jgi:FKBP-type peptidyl-prolyl cis-trans isomerase
MKKIFNTLLLAGAVLVSSTAMAQDQKAKDDKLLQDYFAKNHIKATKTASGLYYIIKKKGTGANAQKGQTVSMNYLGKLLDGTKFDGNVDENYNPAPGRTPFSFKLGVGQVIQGWDEGVQLLNKGCRATLYLPSHLAYGPNGTGPIPPNAVLLFDVEMLDNK